MALEACCMRFLKIAKKKLTAYLHSPNYMYLYADKTNWFVE